MKNGKIDENLVTETIASLAYKNNYNEGCIAFYDCDGELNRIHQSIGYGQKNAIKGELLRSLFNINLNMYPKAKYTAPTYSQIIDWLREERGIIILVSKYFDLYGFSVNGMVFKIFNKNYNDALNLAVLEAFKLISK